MPWLRFANLDGGDTRTFEHGTVQTAKVGMVTVSRGTLEPGWRWSNDVEPTVGIGFSDEMAEYAKPAAPS